MVKALAGVDGVELQAADPGASHAGLIRRLTQDGTLPLLDPLLHGAFPANQPDDPQQLCAAPWAGPPKWGKISP
jgi:hypothetical protein